MDSFCTQSGQRINWSNCRIYFSKNCTQDLKDTITRKLNIKSTHSLGRYLGFPIIFDKLQSKLVGWKTHFLNIAGRTTLAESSPNSIPTHAMQFTKLPSSITKNIDQIQRIFIWRSTSSKEKIIFTKLGDHNNFKMRRWAWDTTGKL